MPIGVLVFIVCGCGCVYGCETLSAYRGFGVYGRKF